LGIPELLLFDPTEEFLNPPCRGWRLVESAPQVWLPDEQGRFSSALGIAFQADGPRLRVLDANLRPIPFRHEKTAALTEQRLLIEEQQRLLATQAEQQQHLLAARIEEQRRMLAALAEQQQLAIRVAHLEAELASLRGGEPGKQQ
jgi:hypothetical protein